MADVRKLATLAEAGGSTGVTFIGNVCESEPYEISPPVLAYSGIVEATDPRWADNFIAKVEGRSPEIELFQLDGAFVTPNSGIFTRTGIIVEESLYPYVRPSDIVDVFKPSFCHEAGRPDNDISILIRNMTMLDGEVVFGREHGEMGYFHWLHSVLPRLLITKQRRPDLRTLVAITEQFQRDSLSDAGFPADTLVLADGNTTVCERLLYCTPMVRPDLARSGGFFERSLLPSTLLRSLPAQAGGKRRLLISRQDAAIRRLVGEQEIAAALQADGFETVTLTEMNFRSQVELFASASTVVGIHGAGLANIAFMRPGSLVVEVLAPDRLWPTYRGVAARSQLHYAPYVGSRAGTMSERDSDIEVASSQFADFVRKCLQAVGL